MIFNLTNEPEFAADSKWSCYPNGGCSTKGLPNSRSKSGNSYCWTVQGTQSVVTAIRDTGATNPIIIAGINYSNQLDHWLSYVPTDPLKQIIAGVHIYFDSIAREDPTCWSSQLGAIQAAGYPVVVDETGEFDTVSGGAVGLGASGRTRHGLTRSLPRLAIGSGPSRLWTIPIVATALTYSRMRTLRSQTAALS